LDIHKDSVAVAIAQAGRDAPQFIGTTAANLAQVCKVLTRQKCAPKRTLVVYEAGFFCRFPKIPRSAIEQPIKP
jgi:hypothetical protein